jgi:hypothetical protein
MVVYMSLEARDQLDSYDDIYLMPLALATESYSLQARPTRNKNIHGAGDCKASCNSTGFLQYSTITTNMKTRSNELNESMKSIICFYTKAMHRKV